MKLKIKLGMKLKIKNPVLRWLAGCGLLLGKIGVVGVILWIMGWLITFIPGFYEEWWQKTITVAAPFDLVILGLLVICVLALTFLILSSFFYEAKEMGNQYFDP